MEIALSFFVLLVFIVVSKFTAKAWAPVIAGWIGDKVAQQCVYPGNNVTRSSTRIRSDSSQNYKWRFRGSYRRVKSYLNRRSTRLLCGQFNGRYIN